MHDSDDEQQEETTRAQQEQQRDEEQPQKQFDIFAGEDSDLTELEDSDDEEGPGTRSRTASPALRRSASPARTRSPTRSPSPDDEDAGDEYQDESARLKKMGKISKKKRSAEDEGDEPRPKKKRSSKKAKRREEAAQREEDEDAQLDPETRRRKQLQNRLDAIVKKPTGKGKKKKQQDEEDLEMMNDEAVATLRSEMLKAADLDQDENDVGRPAVNKLRLLSRVVDLMQKSALADTIVEGGMLEAVKRWLEPLSDKSLPALTIQRPLFTLLKSLPNIETSALKSSGLGKIVYFYTKCRRVDPAIARIANQLVSDWMRPILRRSKAFVDRDASAAHASFSNATLQAAKEVDAGATRHARIPQALTATFAVAPQSLVTGQGAGMPGQGSGARMRQYKQKLQAGQQAARRM
ncbi:transcription factor Iws1 [Rhodotorula toruloides]|uniref:Transcription factor Iws1 n=1 Tax=Rhodotorula toruloides TaxID=5286 RepID=A0A511KNF8_RHOTO|nr:transcription factor Iws1 [Rhodotorula toruloides]